MRLILKVCFFLWLFGFSFYSLAQMSTYDYQRSLGNVSEGWYGVPLPLESFKHLSQDMTDLRIYGITATNDTIEAPFILNSSKSKLIKEKVPFNLLNASQSGNTYHQTFEITEEKVVSEIELNFNEENFEYRLLLEGSNDQNDWFTIQKDYRVLSIKNADTDYKFTKVVMPQSKYRYYRISFNSDKKPELENASIYNQRNEQAIYKAFATTSFEIKHDDGKKVSGVDFSLANPQRVSRLSVSINDDFDYYRPITIKYVADSTATEKGTKYFFKTLYSGTLSSLEKQRFDFSEITAERFRLTIDNGNNQPLQITGVDLEGYHYDLTARFNEKANYFLVYGKENDRFPNYDIIQFKNEIPQNLIKLDVGEQLPIMKKEEVIEDPLFKNQTWLWVIMGIIALILGWFSIKMIKKQSAQE